MSLRIVVVVVVLLTAPAAWGQNPKLASTIQLPTFGVAINAEGELRLRRVDDETGALLAERRAAAKHHLPGAVQAVSPLRKISLRALASTLRNRHQAGERPDEVLLALAGLQRVEFVFCFPERGDIVIAGPAEGWFIDPFQRRLGMSTGRPVIPLEDLMVALRTFAPNAQAVPFVGCTIDPSPNGLAEYQRFQRTIPSVVSDRDRGVVAEQVARRGTRTSLGQANIRVFGVAPNTHLARVMVEADYRMKCMALGLEPPPIQMASYFDSVRSSRGPVIQRWWFTPNYRCLRVAPDELALQLSGDGVQLLTEDNRIASNGVVAGTATNSNPSAEKFARTFTEKFAEIAARSPVYAQLRNVVDLLVVAAACRELRYYDRVSWDAAELPDEGGMHVEQDHESKTTPCVVNVAWKGNRLVAIAGGGVSIDSRRALDRENRIADGREELIERHKQIPEAPIDSWWWD